MGASEKGGDVRKGGGSDATPSQLPGSGRRRAHSIFFFFLTVLDIAYYQTNAV
jgi:hypothetical protein